MDELSIIQHLTIKYIFLFQNARMFIVVVIQIWVPVYKKDYTRCAVAKPPETQSMVVIQEVTTY